MVEALGNKLKINSIDIIPSNIDHHNEYLKVADDESKYDFISVEDINTNSILSEETTASVNKGNNKITDVSSACYSSNYIADNCWEGYSVTTNATQLNGDHPVTACFRCINLGGWYGAKAPNTWVCIKTPYPLAYTSILKKTSYWFDNVNLYEPRHFIVEASNDNVDFDILLDYEEEALYPNRVRRYYFNEEKTKYLYWRFRYPVSGVNGQYFCLCFDGAEYDKNLYTQTEFQKSNLVNLTPMWFSETIPYRTSYGDETGGVVSGSYNITNNSNDSNYWKAFRGDCNSTNQGWLSGSSQTLPVDIIYTPKEPYEPGYYQIDFRNGVWENEWGYTVNQIQFIAEKENGDEIVLRDRWMHILASHHTSEIMYIPFKFKNVKWRVLNKRAAHVGIGSCQVLKYNPEEKSGNILANNNVFMNNTGNYNLTHYNYSNDIKYNVSEENPLEVTFPNRTKKIFTHLDSIHIRPQKKFRLITPLMLSSNTYNPNYNNLGAVHTGSKGFKLTQDYINLVDGTCTGSGAQLDDARLFYRAVCVDRRPYNDCWLTSKNGAMGGPIYVWKQMKPKGRYAFKFNTGWWGDTAGYSAAEFKLWLRKGNSDTWKEVWNVVNIPATYATYWWSPIIDVPFEFDQIYFNMVSRAQANHGGIACCAAFQECDADYQILDKDVNHGYTDLYEKGVQYSYDLAESQNLFLKENGQTYGLSNNVYHTSYKPLEPKEKDIWFNTNNEPIKVYQYLNNEWVEFNDVYLGNIDMFNGVIKSFYDSPYNYNGVLNNSECLWSTELLLQNGATHVDCDIFTSVNLISTVYHNLNIDDTSLYKAECYLKCVNNDCGYKVGDIAIGASVALNDTLYVPMTPYLTKNSIGIWTSSNKTGWKVIHKHSGLPVSIGDSFRWRLVYKIRKL